MDETDIMKRIHELVEEEHRLRAGTDHTEDQRARMQQLEARLDQAWDLLRQRRAKRQYDENLDDAAPRPESTVEDYLQ